jgi:hypothetical protein
VRANLQPSRVAASIRVDDQCFYSAGENRSNDLTCIHSASAQGDECIVEHVTTRPSAPVGIWWLITYTEDIALLNCASSMLDN